MDSGRTLWYKAPASVWTEALPLGNGRIGAMVFGGVKSDRFALNEDTLWSGHPCSEPHSGGPETLKAARELMDAGDFAGAQRLIEDGFTGHFTEAYMPLGDITVERPVSGEISGYTRSLDIRNGVHVTRYTLNGAEHTITSYITFDEPQALIIDHKCSVPGSIASVVRMSSPIRHSVSARDGRLAMVTECPNHARPSYLNDPDPIKYFDEPELRGMRALTQIVCDAPGGSVEISDGQISVCGADRLVMKVCVRTSYAGPDRHPFLEGADFEAASDRDAQALTGLDADAALQKNSAEFRAYMDRVDFSLDSTSTDMPTDQRLEAFLSAKNDRTLYELLFNYGRYLMVAGSQPGTQATNLQGIWNSSPVPPWSSNYTVNINTEMNYYPAEIANLSELHEPLFDLVDKICEKGKTTAQVYYGARGSVCHHNTDLWGRTNPMGEKQRDCAMWSHWPMALAWLCHNMYEHYQYTLDTAFLRERAVPVMREAIRFLLDVMVADERGYLRIFPATSPENTFVYKGRKTALGRSATMSNSICREIMGNYLEALDILGVEDDMAEETRAALDKIWPYETGSKGQILEWDQEYEESEPTHRHTSHLYGLYPGREITPEGTPELAQAARRTLELRGDDGTGWSLGWKVCFYARLNDGDHALKLLNNQLRLVRQNDTTYVMGGGTYPNMFDAHPPFQIDGNFGSCAGMCEFFVHSLPGRIMLLPALPSQWANGHVRGLKAMGNVTVDVEFKNGKLSGAKIVVPDERALPIRVEYAGRIAAEITQTGTTIIGNAE